MSKRKILLIVVGIFFALMLFASMNQPSDQPAQKLTADTSPIFEAPEPEPAPQPLAITATALEKAFDDNEVGAQMKYGAQPLQISGVLTGIALDSDDNAALLLDSGAFLPLRITLPASQTMKAADLKKGQSVTAICNKLSEALGKPYVEDCTLIEN